MKPKYIDCHTHAQFAAFKDDYKEVIGRALEAGVAVVNVGTQRDTSARAVEVAHGFDKLTTSEFSGGVWATVGLHPIHTEKSYHDEQELGVPLNIPNSSLDGARDRHELENKDSEGLSGFTSRGEIFDYEYYKELALDPKTVAIGECGLDYFRIMNNESGIMNVEEIKKKQKEVFTKQIELAKDVQKPLMIHCRDAFGDLIDILKTNANSPAGELKPSVVHFFTGTVEDAKKLLDMGFYFTFGGVITFARNYDEVIKMIPLDRILSETDAPYVTPEPYRGKRNEPAHVVYVVRKLAEIKGVTEEEMAEQIWENARTVFRFYVLGFK